MSGGLFGGYNKLQNAVYSRIDEANAIRLEKAAREYSDYMKNAYRLMNDPNLREIAERRIGDTAMPSAMRTASRETGEMNFGNVLREKPGTVSAEQMYGVKFSQENKNEDFAEWAEKEDAKKKKAAEGAKHIKEQIRENQEILNTKEIAASVDVPFENVNDKRNIREWAVNTLASSGYKANNAELGTVIFDKKRISSAVKYLKTPTEFAAFAVLPDVISKGSVLAIHEDHKGRNYGTYTIIAPIEINGQRGNMAVVVKKTSDNFYKVHRILTPDGKIFDAFETKNTDTRYAGGYVANSDAHAQRMVSVSETNIPQNGNGVNTLDAENSAAGMQQNSENAAKAQRRKPGTVSAEQMYGVKFSQENKNEDFEQWAEKEDAKKKKAAEKEAILAEKQNNADNSNLTNREKYSLSEQEATEIKKGVSVITDADNNTIIDIKSNILENIPKEDWLARVKNVIRSAFSKGFSINGEHIDVSAKSRSEFTNSKDSAYLRDNESEIYADKMKTAPHLDIISQNANYENEAANHDRTDNIMSFDRGKVELRIGGKEYSAEVIIGVRKDGSKVFYDIVGMDANKKAAPIGSQSAQTANTEAQEPSDNISSNDSITDTSENFKSKSENSAAKVQQAETEEEARLRTLYESEPENGQKEAGAGEGQLHRL